MLVHHRVSNNMIFGCVWKALGIQPTDGHFDRERMIKHQIGKAGDD
jgi:hypothetical protein